MRSPVMRYALFTATIIAGCSSSSPITDSGALTSHALALRPSVMTGTIYVADQGASAIDKYPLSARGNQRPLATISGPDTRLNSPFDVAVDNNGNIDVPNYTASEIDEYAPDASGDAPPIATIAGPQTQLRSPQAIRIDPNGRMYVRCRHLIAEFAPG